MDNNSSEKKPLGVDIGKLAGQYVTKMLYGRIFNEKREQAFIELFGEEKYHKLWDRWRKELPKDIQIITECSTFNDLFAKRLGEISEDFGKFVGNLKTSIPGNPDYADAMIYRQYRKAWKENFFNKLDLAFEELKSHGFETFDDEYEDWEDSVYDFRCAELKNLDFKYFVLKGAHFEGANFVNTVFEAADLSSANFYAADLDSVNMTRILMNFADFSYADCSNAQFDHSFLNNSKFRCAELEKASFKNVLCFSADFTETKGDYIDFSELKADHSNFENAHYFAANLYKADLYKCNIRQSSLRGCDFIKAKVCETDFSYSDLDHAEFYKAD
ncbi:MAG: pentapeptide repeat-containing protein [bacterium]